MSLIPLLLAACAPTDEAAGGDPGAADTPPSDTGAADTASTDTDPGTDTGPADTAPCAPGLPVDTGPAPDTGVDTGLDTGPGTSDTGAWEAPSLSCALTTPLVVDPTAMPALLDLRGPGDAMWYVLGVVASHESMFSDGACPTSSCDWSFEGPCDWDDGFTWEGRFRTMPGYRAEGVRMYSGGSTTALDGSHRTGANRWIHDDFTYAFGSGHTPDDTWTVYADGSGDPRGWTLTWQASHTTADGAREDHCVAIDVDTSRGCTREPWGGWVLQGDSLVVATYDPDVACDGCANLTIDGVPAGKSCDPYPTW